MKEVVKFKNKEEDEKEVKEVRIGFRVDKNLRDEFSRICSDNSLNASDLLRKYVENYVQHHKDK